MKVDRPGLLRHHDPGQPPQGGRAEHDQERAAEVRFARSLRRRMDSCSDRAVHRQPDGKATAAWPSASARNTAPSAPQLVKEAAKEAVQGVGFDVLIVCGFAFDPTFRGGQALRQADRAARADEPRPGHGRRTVEEDRRRQPVHGLRRARRGHHEAEGRQADASTSRAWTSTTRRPGRSATPSTDDIACWFIDTDYNGESFFVRHAYFTGADEPYEKLKRALRAEIDEAAWSALYRPPAAPSTRPRRARSP